MFVLKYVNDLIDSMTTHNPLPLGICQAFFCLTAPLTGSVFAKKGQHMGELLLKTNYLIAPID